MSSLTRLISDQSMTYKTNCFVLMINILLCKYQCHNYFRRPSEPQWWMKIRSIIAILSQHDSTYQVEGLDPESHTDGETLD